MRISGGICRGRTLKVPPGVSVRPTTDKVRQAIFNILTKYGYPDDAVVLDIFCGSGALGLEALSRGAKHAIFIEKERSHMKFTQDNAAATKMNDRCTFILKDALVIGQRPAAVPAATLLFLDPPYRMNLLIPALVALTEGDWLAPEACVVCEHEKSAVPAFPKNLILLDQRRYGDTNINFLRYQA